MRALHQIDLGYVDRRLDGARDLGAQGPAAFTSTRARHSDALAAALEGHPHAVIAQRGAHEPRRHGDLPAEGARRLDHGTGQLRIIGLGVVIADDRIETARLQAVELRPLALGHAAEARARIESAEQGVEPQPELELPRTAARLP